MHKKYFTARPSRNNQPVTQLRTDGVYIGKIITLYSRDEKGFYIDHHKLNQEKGWIMTKEYIMDSVRATGQYAFFLYLSNAVVRDGGGDSAKIVEIYNNKQFKSKESYVYGGFRIMNDSIDIQTIVYLPQFHWCVISYRGRIINDTTIYISDCFFPERDGNCYKKFYLHFIPTPKPDSLNRWVKKKWYWKKRSVP